MSTKVADVIVPSVFQPYVINRTSELSALVQAGIIGQDPAFDTLANGGGRTVNMPFWNDLTGDDEVLSDSAGLTPGKIDSAQDIAAIHNRGRAWGTNDLAKWLAGSDPMAAIGTLVGGYWARRLQAATLSILEGVFAAASMADNLHDIAAADVTNPANAVLMDGAVMIDSLAKLGDASGGLTAIAVHSVVEAGMRKKDLIDDIPDSEGKGKIAVYQGRRVIVDDGMPVANVTGGKKYTSYLFGAGALALGNASLDANEAVETDRDSLAGEDYLINRRRFLLHPRGVKWVGTPAGQSPTNAEMKTGTNWVRVYEKKQVRIVAVTTNG